jgi:uncharacterized protein (TIGR02145 family)
MQSLLIVSIYKIDNWVIQHINLKFKTKDLARSIYIINFANQNIKSNVKNMNKIYCFISFCFVLYLFSSCDTKDELLSTDSSTDSQFNSELKYNTVSDVDGNVYKTITIGTQTWMAENLRTTKFRNGKLIPSVNRNDDWYALKTGGQSTYKNNTRKDSIIILGRLYNWYAVKDSNNIAPTGWHVPTDNEWKILQDYLSTAEFNNGFESNLIANSLASTISWSSGLIGNNKTNNKSGFSALPAGSRAYYGTYGGLNTSTCYFGIGTNSQYSACYWIGIGNSISNIGSWGYGGAEGNGFSVRCVKD